MITCPDCKASVEEDAIFCDNCGYQLRPLDSPPGHPAPPAGTGLIPGAPPNTCPSCGYLNSIGDPFCVNCGAQLTPGLDLTYPTPPPAARMPFAPLVESAAPASDSVARPAADRLCPACGFSNPAGNLFCGNCGTQLNLFQSASVAQPEGPPAPSIKVCPNCGYPNPPGETSCQVCSYRLPEAAAHSLDPSLSTLQVSPNQTIAGQAASASLSVGRLLAVATNTSFAIPARPEVLIGRRDPDKGILPEIDLWKQGTSSSSVSRKHARLLMQGGQVFVEDLKSTNATYLNRQRLQPGIRYPLQHGDELQIGGVSMVYYKE